MSKPLAFVIEDDPQLNQVFTLTLSEDFNAQSILNGDEAIERLMKETPRLIILDLNLPVVSGGDILSYIRASEKLKNATVVVCTADDRQAEQLRDNAEFILLKPVSPIQLRQIASRLK